MCGWKKIRYRVIYENPQASSLLILRSRSRAMIQLESGTDDIDVQLLTVILFLKEKYYVHRL